VRTFFIGSTANNYREKSAETIVASYVLAGEGSNFNSEERRKLPNERRFAENTVKR
jgi:hypothetical protein